MSTATLPREPKTRRRSHPVRKPQEHTGKKLVSTRSYVLRGYVKEREDGRFVGVCLKPNLVVEASTQDAALRQLRDLIGAYIMDAAKDGQLDYFMSRRAPARFYTEYAFGRCLSLIHSMNRAFLTFTETKPVRECIA